MAHYTLGFSERTRRITGPPGVHREIGNLVKFVLFCIKLSIKAVVNMVRAATRQEFDPRVCVSAGQELRSNGAAEPAAVGLTSRPQDWPRQRVSSH